MMPETIDTLKRELTSRPEVLLIHGTEDKTVPFNSLENAENLLREFDVPYEAHAIEGMGHTIDNEALEYATDFIKKICNKTKNN